MDGSSAGCASAKRRRASTFSASGVRRRATFFECHLAARQRPEGGRPAGAPTGVVEEAGDDLGQREIVVGVEVARDARAVVGRKQVPWSVALYGGLDRPGGAVAAGPGANRCERDVEALGDLELRGIACKHGVDDALPEVDRERNGHERGGGNALKHRTYLEAALAVSRPRRGVHAVAHVGAAPTTFDLHTVGAGDLLLSQSPT